MIRVFVDGQEGTTGLEIFQRLEGRAEVELLRIAGERRKDPAARRELIHAADAVFLCLPDAAARESAALAEGARACVIDASTAHRTDAGWVYGLPELQGQRARIRGAKRIAVPGCHATGFVLLMAPLVRAGLVPSGHGAACFSLTGYSGGGRKMIEMYEKAPPPALGSPRPYALGQEHKHLPEMRRWSGLAAPPVFQPVVAAFYRGMAVMVPLHLKALPGAPSLAAMHAALADAYAGERFVRVMGLGREEDLDGGFLDAQGCNGTNRADLFVLGNDERCGLVCRLDNLGKGASGAAVQCMNLALGLEEGAGLEG